MIYVAVDPGVVSGVAVWSSDAHLGSVALYEIGTLEETASLVRSHHRNHTVSLICERFLISARTIKTKVYYDSVWFEGWCVIEYPHVHQQTAAQAKGFATDALLKHLGWYDKTKDGHSNDAARHLLYRAVKDRNPTILEALEDYSAD